MKKRHTLALLLLVPLTASVFISRGYLGSLLHPLPFDGPYNGTIVDAATGKPVADARVVAKWWCYDSPDPHFGNYWITISATADEGGRYELKKPRRREGWFGSSFTLSINARGYVPVVVITPDIPPLPPATRAYPFTDTRAYPSLPSSLDITLNPFRPILLETLISENNDYRGMAALELGNIGNDAGYAVQPLIHRLNDEEVAVRRYSAEALGKIGDGAKQAAPALAACLNDEDEGVRLAAIDALGSIGNTDDAIVGALINQLTGRDNQARVHAVRSLMKFGPRAKAAAPMLKSLLEQKWISRYFRRDINDALEQISPAVQDEISRQ
jgi:hypothetical protein